MCSKEVFPFHPIYLKYPFFLPVPAPDGLHIIQVASFCLCFQQAKAKDLLCVISWTLGVALQITKGDARFLHSCHFHLFFFPQLFIVFTWVIPGRFSSHSVSTGTKGFACEEKLPQEEPIPGGSCSLSLLTASWQNAPPTPWESSTHLLHPGATLLQPP